MARSLVPGPTKEMVLAILPNLLKVVAVRTDVRKQKPTKIKV